MIMRTPQVWSFARQGLQQRRLLESSADVALSQLEHFNMRNMANLMWGYARMEYYNPSLYGAVAARATAMLQVWERCGESVGSAW